MENCNNIVHPDVVVCDRPTGLARVSMVQHILYCMASKDLESDKHTKLSCSACINIQEEISNFSATGRESSGARLHITFLLRVITVITLPLGPQTHYMVPA